ncbi:MAG TPA: tRNA 2-thiocytidine biosynthesis TtcA family protein [Rectinemataceae bacterium]|nr:tRNA 2-thiocytidine biosynthesis TtcA family protein [Rectinemataceae bacterium]
MTGPSSVEAGDEVAVAGRVARRLGAKGAVSAVGKLVEVALRRYSMIEEGDRILVAVSGGKDSTALACDLAAKRRWWPVNYELRAIHIATDFCNCCKKTKLVSLLESWEIPYVSIDVPVIGRLKPGRSMNCYWCSTQRRTELIRYAMANGFNKIALGHHLDDAVETLLMNMLYKSEISGMLPVLRYKKYPLSIIRPLTLCEESQIVAFAEEKDFRSAACTCPFGRESKRREVRKRIAALTGGSSAMKRSLFESAEHVNGEYLPSGPPLAGAPDAGD